MFLWCVILIPRAYPELFALVGGRVPDYRGLFLRGLGGNSAALGVTQGDAFASHTHYSYGTRHGRYGANPGGRLFGSDGDTSDGYGPAAVQPTGDTETRPKNTAVRYLVRAKN